MSPPWPHSNRQLYNQMPKLSDALDYPAWRYAIEALLKLDGLWRICTGTEPDRNAKRLERLNLAARVRIIQTLEPDIYSLILGEKTAHGMWEALRLAFEEHSWAHRATLVQQLLNVSLALDDCATMEEYVTPIMEAVHGLRDAGVQTLDDVAGAVLLAGLDSKFDPMVRSIDNAEAPLTTARIRQRLLRVDLQAVRAGKRGKAAAARLAQQNAQS